MTGDGLVLLERQMRPYLDAFLRRQVLQGHLAPGYDLIPFITILAFQHHNPTRLDLRTAKARNNGFFQAAQPSFPIQAAAAQTQAHSWCKRQIVTGRGHDAAPCRRDHSHILNEMLLLRNISFTELKHLREHILITVQRCLDHHGHPLSGAQVFRFLGASLSFVHHPWHHHPTQPLHNALHAWRPQTFTGGIQLQQFCLGGRCTGENGHHQLTPRHPPFKHNLAGCISHHHVCLLREICGVHDTDHRVRSVFGLRAIAQVIRVELI